MTKFRQLPIVLILVLLLIPLAACGATQSSSSSSTEESTGGYQSISPETAQAMLEEGGVTLVDVRTQSEYESAHIPGAILIPNETIADTQPEALPDKNAAIVVYCRSGRRSAEAASKLAALGYTDIYDLGGIIDWPYDTVSGSEP